jgi:purine-binding chemotaxis protein CheW
MNDVAAFVGGGPGGDERQTSTASDEEITGASLWLLCEAGSHRFALPVTNVIETMRILPLETIASAPAIVLGLSIIRGDTVPVIDTARLFGGEFVRYERLVSARTSSRTVAFAASAVIAVQSIADTKCHELPPLLQDADAIAAIARLDGEFAFLLQTARVVPDDLSIADGDQQRGA